jgi:hypothetical protein
MRRTGQQRWPSSLATLATAIASTFGPSAWADDAPKKHGAPLHGGTVKMTKEYHIEAVFTTDGVKLYPRTHGDEPLDTSKVTATATFYHPNSPKPWFEQKLAPAAAKPGTVPSSLDASVGLSKVPASGAKVAFKIGGLPEAAEPEATFTVPFVLTAPAVMLFTKATKADEAAIAAQKTCKVSGQPLGSMGTPIKVSLGERSTYLCCQNCLKKVQAEPDKYLGPPAPAAIKVEKATKADQAAIDAQKTCPVSHEELDAMGGPWKVTRGDRSVLICCKNCLKDVTADPDKYLKTSEATKAPTSREDR